GPVAAVAASGLAIGWSGRSDRGSGAVGRQRLRQLGPGRDGRGRAVPAGGDAGGAAQPPAAPKVTNAAQAADLVLRKAEGGRVTGVKLVEEGGRAVWKVIYLAGARQRGAQVDALTPG